MMSKCLNQEKVFFYITDRSFNITEDGFDPWPSGLRAKEASAALHDPDGDLNTSNLQTSDKPLSRGWFRSIDLWVMGPARFRCATLLHTSLNGI